MRSELVFGTGALARTPVVPQAIPVGALPALLRHSPQRPLMTVLDPRATFAPTQLQSAIISPADIWRALGFEGLTKTNEDFPVTEGGGSFGTAARDTGCGRSSVPGLSRQFCSEKVDFLYRGRSRQ
jgi:hypothetical protein